MARIRCELPLNRVEGDLEIRVEVEDGVIIDAWSAGTMFRGFERMLAGRGALDGLVLTPRICGICSTTHLLAAAKALDAACGAAPPPQAVRLRNVALMTEHVQSDVRQAVLMYMVDFANAAHRSHPLFEEAVARFAPLAGRDALDTIRETKRVLEVVAILGGQWPHSSYMVPGGLASTPSGADLRAARSIVRRYRAWYESTILGCPIERWRAVASAGGLQAWLDEAEAHRTGVVGFFLRFAGAAGLDRIGRGPGNFLSYGSLDLPGEAGRQLVPAGTLIGGTRAPFAQDRIAEDVSHSWAAAHAGSRHPFAGETAPCRGPADDGRYSWSKAPRYDGAVMETGPLAEALITGDGLFTDLAARGGPSAMLRQFARLVRPAALLPQMEAWLDEAARDGSPCYVEPPPLVDGEGYGLIQAARGALGHWVRIRDGRIAHYQIITPTAWNGSPRDAAGQRGAWEQALVGTPLTDPDNPVEAGHVVRSFDPCLVCTVHAVRRGRVLGRARVGG